MKKLLSIPSAAHGLIALLGCLLGFHLLIVLRVLPFEIVWGGKLRSEPEMMQLEITSIVVTGILLCAVMLRVGYFRVKLNPLIFKVVFGLMVLLFTLNTLGNILSENAIERAVFTPVTILMALLSLRLALGE